MIDYTEIKTSNRMNKVVKEQLIFRDDHLSKYAAKRIDELEQLILSGVVGQSEQLCEGLHSTDFNGKCFKCGEQVFVREPK